jgi:sugar/nucleoside kinase (ribokinase family)
VKFDVAVVGAPFLDLTFEGLPHVPSVGEETVARALHIGPGGTGMQAIGAARLGLEAALVAAIGPGAAARLVIDVLESEGVKVVGARADSTVGLEGVPVTALLATTEGVAMATALRGDEPRPEDTARVRARAALLSLGRLSSAPPGAAVYAVTGGLELPSIDRSTLARLRTARALVLNAAEAAAISGRADTEDAARVLARDVEVAVVTLGPGGALACSDGNVVRARAPSVEAVDATGAGDLFAAAYVWADLSGAPLPDRLEWACLCASLSVRAPTALAGAPSLEELVSEGVARGMTPPARDAPRPRVSRG